jgi:glycosyltransferase involved in cell wall biosynthesis
MSMATNDHSSNPDCLIVGHPYAAIGMGAHCRGVVRSLAAAHGSLSVHDVYKITRPMPREAREFGPLLTEQFSAPVRIFCINGDEIDAVVRTIEQKHEGAFSSGYNIIYPMWELPRYPQEWARHIERFDEVWSPSLHVNAALRAATQRPVFHMPIAVEPRVHELFDRKYFGIPESRYAMLFFFDALSYASRKNPWAAIDVFKRVLAQRPLAKLQLVLKINNSARDAQSLQRLKAEIEPIRDRVTLIDKTMTEEEVKSLVRVCDSFLSLHRAEGFGLGPAEAMFFDKPVVVTAWSGNMDYMSTDNSLGVRYSLVPLGEGDYPHWQDQVWADADLDDAAQKVLMLFENPEFGRQMGKRAGIHMRTHFSHRRQGLRYREQLRRIASTLLQER